LTLARKRQAKQSSARVVFSKIVFSKFLVQPLLRRLAFSATVWKADLADMADGRVKE
jgi:hypothetical protein